MKWSMISVKLKRWFYTFMPFPGAKFSDDH